jgi:hypothetical protein
MTQTSPWHPLSSPSRAPSCSESNVPNFLKCVMLTTGCWHFYNLDCVLDFHWLCSGCLRYVHLLPPFAPPKPSEEITLAAKATSREACKGDCNAILSATPCEVHLRLHLQKFFPLFPCHRHGSHMNVLPCPGNIMCWGLVPPTMLLGHGSTFQHLPCWCCTHIQTPYAAPPTLSTRHGRCWNMQKCKDHNCGSCPSCPPITVGWCGMNRGVPTPPLQSKKQKPHQYCQAVLRHFLATLLAIRCNQVPDFDGVHPQGVY